MNNMNTSTSHHEIKLFFEFDWMEVKHCNFNMSGKLIFFCGAETYKYDDVGTPVNLVCVYSIEDNDKNEILPTKETKCQKIYMIPKEAEVISISEHDKIWLRLNHDIYEWNLLTGHTTIILKNPYEVINIFFFLKKKRFTVSLNLLLIFISFKD